MSNITDYRYHKQVFTGFVMAGIILLMPGLVFAKHAKAQEKTQEKNSAPFMGTSTATEDQTPTQPQDNVQPIATSTPQSPQPQASSTPVTDATTTPDQERQNQSKKDTPKNSPEYNQNLESILNEVLPPASDTTKKAPAKPATTHKLSPTTTNTIAGTTTESTSTPITTQTTAPTSTAGIISRIISGNSNQFAPNNYYVPLDNLSPEMTYGLSGLAMVFGIVGAVMVLGDPSEEREVVWAPTFSGESLQES